jgi:small-conductance mechanosensitive channel
MMHVPLADLTGRLVATGVTLAVALALAVVGGQIATRRAADGGAGFQLRRTIRSLAVIAALVALGFVWHVFGTRGGVFLGLLAAGFAFAMQEVVGAVAGWFNILSGGIYRVGDVVEIGGVRGTVIDLTPLRTKLLELGAAPNEVPPSATSQSWVQGRQATGRIVSISNKATFENPVFNFSSIFEYLWDELTLPISYRSDWREAERIMLEEAKEVSHGEGAREAVEEMTRRYPVARVELEPRVFVRATDNWMELSARFVVGVQEARRVKDEMTRRITDRFAEAGIQISSATSEIQFRPMDDAPPLDVTSGSDTFSSPDAGKD